MCLWGPINLEIPVESTPVCLWPPQTCIPSIMMMVTFPNGCQESPGILRHRSCLAGWQSKSNCNSVASRGCKLPSVWLSREVGGDPQLLIY